MAARKQSDLCFIHDPAVAKARSAARAKGGAAQKQRQALPLVPAPVAAGARFEIGEIRRKGDVARVLVRLARAIAKGEVDPKTGRLVSDALRMASAAAGDGSELGDGNDGAPLGARPATDAELDFVIKHGQLPEGVDAAGPQVQELWVFGSEWRPPAIEAPAPAADDERES